MVADYPGKNPDNKVAMFVMKFLLVSDSIAVYQHFEPILTG